MLRPSEKKYQSLVTCKIARAVDKNKVLNSNSILGAMIMPQRSWGEVTKNIIHNCFGKAEISMQSQGRA